MAAARRTTTARKPRSTAAKPPTTSRGKPTAAVVPPPLLDEDGHLVPLVLDVPVDEQAPVERVALFSIGGVEYTAPVHIPRGLGLRIIRTNLRRGDDQAAVQMLEEVLGLEGFEALTAHLDQVSDVVADAQLKQVFAAVRHLALGAVEIPKG